MAAGLLAATAAGGVEDIPARMHAQRVGEELQLSWPMTGLTWEVQVSENVGEASIWEVLNKPVRAVEGRWVVSVTADGSRRFYRLARPLIHHVLVVGQSLAMGALAEDILSTNQPFQNVMFIGQRLDGGRPGLLPDDLSALVPLRESWQASQKGGETIGSGFANWVGSQTAGERRHDVLVSNCARGSSDYSVLKRIPSSAPEEVPTGTYPYLRGLEQVAAGRRLLGPSGHRFEAILAVHGEGDSFNAEYDRNIREWRQDYEADIHRLTGQTNRIPMFHTQISAWGYLGNAQDVWSPFKVLDEYERDPTGTVLVGPKYVFPYRPEDGLHLTSVGYRWLGEYYAKAYYRHVVLGQPWSPLRPVPGGITRSSNVVDIRLTGYTGDLVLDTNLVSDPAGTVYDPDASPSAEPALLRIGPYGFEYWDTAGSGDPWICDTYVTNISVILPDRIRVHLNRVPLGDRRRIRYGFTALPRSAGGGGGPLLGPRGCLRDSDPAPSRYGHTLYNWCVHFDRPCP